MARSPTLCPDLFDLLGEFEPDTDLDLTDSPDTPTFCPYGECDSWTFRYEGPGPGETYWTCAECGKDFSRKNGGTA